MAKLRSSCARGVKVLAVAFPVAAMLSSGRAADGPSTDRYRVPRWVELIGSEGAKPSVTSPSRRSAPVAEAPAAPLPLPQSAAANASPIAASPVTIHPTPPADGGGKPGRTLLRSRAAAEVGAQARLVSGWGEIGDASTADTATLLEADDADGGKGRALLGAEQSVLEADDLPGDVSPATSDEPRLAPPAPEARSVAVEEGTSPPEPPGPADDDTPPAPTAAKATTNGEPELAVEPVTFAGILVGRTDRAGLRAAMEREYGIGDPFTREDGTEGFAWSLADGVLERVEATLDGDTVGSLRLKLADPLSVDQLTAMFQIGDIASVSILDESGVSIGEVFPEVGLIFSLKPGTRSALAVMIEPLDPEAFVLRAEGELETDTALAITDLKFAVTLDPQHLRARRMLLALLSEQGKWQQALELGLETERLDPEDVWTRLKNASILVALDRFEDARQRLEAAKTLPRIEGVGTAHVERMLGRIAIDGEQPDSRAAVRHFETSIRTANQLRTARSESIRDAARDILIDTHLGMAVAIAKGEWQRKGEVVSKWLAAATKLVESVDDDADDRPILEIQLCRGALAAAATCEAVDPLPWVKRLLVTRDRMSADLADAWQRRQVDWEVGHGLADALAATRKRGEGSDSLDNATLTVAYLERGAEQRELTDAERASIGDILFRIGILHGLQNGDHATAVTWFDKVHPYWNGNGSFVAHGETGRLGESYVSMAVSYWQVDRRDDALDLCLRGIDCMVAAVDAKLMDEPALALAYDNLSKMYAEQGEEERSRTYAEMAGRAEAANLRR